MGEDRISQAFHFKLPNQAFRSCLQAVAQIRLQLTFVRLLWDQKCPLITSLIGLSYPTVTQLQDQSSIYTRANAGIKQRLMATTDSRRLQTVTKIKLLHSHPGAPDVRTKCKQRGTN